MLASRDDVLVRLTGEDRGAVEHVGEVGARRAVGDAGEAVEVDVLGERLRARVHVEDRAAALLGREVDVQLGPEAAGAQDRRVERVEPVGGGDDRSRGCRC